jgi:S-disulfanyl-L-cysteine oxidoreductase SoxD
MTVNGRTTRGNHVVRALSLLVLLGAVSATALGQKAETRRTTLTGVYSEQQAARGQDVYAGMCKSCHTAASHTGIAFEKSWDGHSLSELFGFISRQMPKNEPGSLAPEEYVDVLAYLLKLNQMPAGAAELPADTTVLGAIRIETHAAAKPPNR